MKNYIKLKPTIRVLIYLCNQGAEVGDQGSGENLKLVCLQRS